MLPPVSEEIESVDSPSLQLIMPTAYRPVHAPRARRAAFPSVDSLSSPDISESHFLLHDRYSREGNVRLICQMRSELRFSYWAAIVNDVRAICRLVVVVKCRQGGRRQAHRAAVEFRGAKSWCELSEVDASARPGILRERERDPGPDRQGSCGSFGVDVSSGRAHVKAVW